MIYDMSMKILHAPLNTASDPKGLVAGLRSLGHDADLATTSVSHLVDDGNIDLSFSSDNSLVRQMKKWNFCRTRLLDYDVVHFHTGHSILDYGNGSFALMDAKKLLKQNVPLFVTFHGCDVRDLQLGGCPNPCADRFCQLGNKKMRLDFFQRFSHNLFVSTPDLLSAIPEATVLPQSVIGIEDFEWAPPNTEGTLTIVHAPSRRAVKGSDEIIAAVNQLISEGNDLRLDLVENVSHKEALEAIKRADIVVDQLHCGWYGVVSVEAAAFGKPVVVRIDEEYVKMSQMSMPPFVNATKETLYDKLKFALSNRSNLPAMGKQGRDFVMMRHSPLTNAKRLLVNYQEALDV